MIEIDKLVGEISKKEMIKLNDNIGKSIKSEIEDHQVCTIINPKYAALAHVKGKNKSFEAYVFCDWNGNLYSCGKINAAETAVAYMRELENESEDYQLSFTFEQSKKTGNRFIRCELI